MRYAFIHHSTKPLMMPIVFQTARAGMLELVLTVRAEMVRPPVVELSRNGPSDQQCPRVRTAPPPRRKSKCLVSEVHGDHPLALHYEISRCPRGGEQCDRQM